MSVRNICRLIIAFVVTWGAHAQQASCAPAPRYRKVALPSNFIPNGLSNVEVFGFQAPPIGEGILPCASACDFTGWMTFLGEVGSMITGESPNGRYRVGIVASLNDDFKGVSFSPKGTVPLGIEYGYPLGVTDKGSVFGFTFPPFNEGEVRIPELTAPEPSIFRMNDGKTSFLPTEGFPIGIAGDGTIGVVEYEFDEESFESYTSLWLPDGSLSALTLAKNVTVNRLTAGGVIIGQVGNRATLLGPRGKVIKFGPGTSIADVNAKGVAVGTMTLGVGRHSTTLGALFQNGQVTPLPLIIPMARGENLVPFRINDNGVILAARFLQVPGEEYPQFSYTLLVPNK